MTNGFGAGICPGTIIPSTGRKGELEITGNGLLKRHFWGFIRHFPCRDTDFWLEIQVITLANESSMVPYCTVLDGRMVRVIRDEQ